MNFGIVPKGPPASQHDLEWEIFPYDGNCGDYAVTKRHLLLRAGWPSSALLLAEVVIRLTAEHHLVLLVREARGVLVLDNLSPVVLSLMDALDRYIARSQEQICSVGRERYRLLKRPRRERIEVGKSSNDIKPDG